MDAFEPTLLRAPKSGLPADSSVSTSAEGAELGHALMRFGHACSVALDSALSREQLTTLEWQALQAIYLMGEPTVAQISRRIYRAAPQATALMTRLCARGWTTTKGGHGATYTLTDQALKVLPFPDELVSALSWRTHTALTEAERRQLADLLRKVLGA